MGFGRLVSGLQVAFEGLDEQIHFGADVGALTAVGRGVGVAAATKVLGDECGQAGFGAQGHINFGAVVFEHGG
jgi:hypothetical protein